MLATSDSSVSGFVGCSVHAVDIPLCTQYIVIPFWIVKFSKVFDEGKSKNKTHGSCPLTGDEAVAG